VIDARSREKKVTTTATVPPARTISNGHYPDSDGRPTGETPLHADNLAYFVNMLRMWYEQESQVFIVGNLFLYYVPGDRLKTSVARCVRRPRRA
jgi:hypothetical protein